MMYKSKTEFPAALEFKWDFSLKCSLQEQTTLKILTANHDYIYTHFQVYISYRQVRAMQAEVCR